MDTPITQRAITEIIAQAARLNRPQPSAAAITEACVRHYKPRHLNRTFALLGTRTVDKETQPARFTPAPVKGK